VSLNQSEVAVFGVGDALLYQYDLAIADVFLDEHIRAGEHEVIRPSTPPPVDGEILSLQILPASPGEFVADDGELQQLHPPHQFECAVAVIGRERLLVLGQMVRDLVHLRGLVHRAADEEDALGHSQASSPHRVLNVPAVNATTANAAVAPAHRSVAASSTKIIEARSASFT